MKKETVIAILAVLFLILVANALLRYEDGLNFYAAGDNEALKDSDSTVNVINGDLYASAFSESQKKEIISYVYSAVDDYLEAGPSAEPDFGDVDFKYSRVFVTFIKAGKVRCCQSGTADSDSADRLQEDLKTAVAKCANDTRFDGKLTKEELPELAMTVDFLYNEQPVARHAISDLKKEIEVGLNAIKVSENGKSAIFKASVPIEKNYDLATTFERLCVKAKLAGDCYKDKQTKIYKYDSVNFKGDRAGNVVDLYRSNVLLEEKNINKDRVMQSIRLGYDWLANNVNPDTKMVEYMYAPTSDSYDNSTNHIRILAATWATSEMMDFLNTDSMSGTVRATLDSYFDKYKRRDEKGVYLSIDGESKIAFNAFPLMALINTKDYPERSSLMAALADRIVAQQQSDGRFLTDFENGGESGADYYVGESLLALTKYYYETGDRKYYDAVAKAFPYYRDYWRGNRNTAFIPWQTQAYHLMYKKTANEEWKDFVFEMNDWLIDNYQQTKSEFPDYLGGFKKIPGNSSSAYAEGVSDAYALAKLSGDKQHEKKFLNSARLVLRFVMQAQLTAENSFYYQNTRRTVGGFRISLLDNNIRCDNNQHAVLSLIKAVHYGIFD